MYEKNDLEDLLPLSTAKLKTFKPEFKYERNAYTNEYLKTAEKKYKFNVLHNNKISILYDNDENPILIVRSSCETSVKGDVIITTW